MRRRPVSREASVIDDTVHTARPTGMSCRVREDSRPGQPVAKRASTGCRPACGRAASAPDRTALMSGAVLPPHTSGVDLAAGCGSRRVYRRGRTVEATSTQRCSSHGAPIWMT